MDETAEILSIREELLSAPAPAMPPAELRSIVAGTATEQEFLTDGLNHLLLFLGLYERFASERPARPRVLDLGCGCGRLTRHLNGSDRFETFACDLNPDHVAWCRKNLVHVTTVRNRPSPPLPFPAGKFDLVYALSVVTHLPERVSLAFIADIARVLRPNGIAVVTTHGYPALATMLSSPPHLEMMAMSRDQTQAIKDSLPTAGYAYVSYAPEVVTMANVRTEYGLSFTDPGHANRTWAAFLEPLAHVEGALGGWQDAFVLRARPRPADATRPKFSALSLMTLVGDFLRRRAGRAGQ